MTQPLDNLVWLDRELLTPNDYNPNTQPPPEKRLLKISILEDGWTQPIVCFREEDSGDTFIVDGEHRWLTSGDKEVYALTDGKVPVVFINGDREHRQMATIRHNRARGNHTVLPMAEIVRSLLEAGTSVEDIMQKLQMEGEEVERLAERAGLPEVISRGKKDFTKSWVPK